MSEFEHFRRYIVCVLIAHHIPGRIRLKLDPAKLSKAEASAVKGARDFRRLLDGIPGIHSIRLNLLALSCIVEYDTQVIPVEAWSDLLLGARTAAAGILENILEQKFAQIRGA